MSVFPVVMQLLVLNLCAYWLNFPSHF
jgi:hypothetical protein